MALRQRKIRVVPESALPHNWSMENSTAEQHYATVARALHYLAEHQDQQPGLDELAGQLGLSPFHLQRTFQNWAGVSPKQFLALLTRDQALDRLRRGASVFDAALDAGLSGPGRLHDLLVKTDALTPGDARRGGAGLSMEYGTGDSPFGPALVAWTRRGISFLAFLQEDGEGHALDDLQTQWPRVQLNRNQAQAQTWLQQIFASARQQPLPVWLRGSPFQLKVWRALLAIPDDAWVSYADIARAIGQPGAARAVGSAVGKNPIAWLIPCHRVIRSVGEFGQYRWGAVTKQAMLGWEQAAHDRAEKVA